MASIVCWREECIWRATLEFVGGEGSWPAADSSSGSGGAESGQGAVADDVAFELGE